MTEEAKVQGEIPETTPMQNKDILELMKTMDKDRKQIESTTQERNYQDSFTIGTPAKGGSFKVYFDSNNFKDGTRKIASLLLLFNKFQDNKVDLVELDKIRKDGMENV